MEAIPEGMRIRTVIGIYPEPATIATTDRTEMKERLLAQSARLLEREVYVEIATHDEHYLRRFFDEVIGPRKVPGSRFEVQMLYGVPRAALLHQVVSGQWSADATPPRGRLYVPYATAWDQATAYCRRRLRSNPDLAIYVVRNLIASLRGRRPGIAQYLPLSGRQTPIGPSSAAR